MDPVMRQRRRTTDVQSQRFELKPQQHTEDRGCKKSPIENEAGIKRFWLHFLEKE